MYTKKFNINDIKENDRVEDIFVVKIRKGISTYQRDGKTGFFFTLILSDASGRSIEYKYWGGTDEEAVRKLYESVKDDSVIFVQGYAKMNRYRNRLEIHTNEPDTIRVLNEGEYDAAAFIKKPKRDLGEMFNELTMYINSIKNPAIKQLLKTIFSNNEIAEKFKTHPGAIEYHHNWIGGLLQHTLEVVKYCDLSTSLFGDLDRDILIAGAILHDIGKLQEIRVTSRIKGTKKGQLKGHIAMGFAFLSKLMDELGTNEDVRDKLLHIILSHHGKNDFGSPKEPMFPEAVVVYYADELSSKTAEMIEFKNMSKEDTEDDFMYHKRYKRNILLR